MVCSCAGVDWLFRNAAVRVVVDILQKSCEDPGFVVVEVD